LVEARNRLVEAQALDVLADGLDRLVRRLRDRSRIALPRRRGRNAGDRRRYLRDEAPHSLNEAVRPVDAGRAPDDVTLWWRIRQHEPTRSVGTIACNDVVRVDDVLLRLRHLLDRSDLDLLAIGDQA